MNNVNHNHPGWPGCSASDSVRPGRRTWVPTSAVSTVFRWCPWMFAQDVFYWPYPLSSELEKSSLTSNDDIVKGNRSYEEGGLSSLELILVACLCCNTTGLQLGSVPSINLIGPLPLATWPLRQLPGTPHEQLEASTNLQTSFILAEDRNTKMFKSRLSIPRDDRYTNMYLRVLR